MAVKESYAGKINRKLTKKLRVIAVAAGREKADLVLKNATYVNVFSNELCHGDIAVAEGLIVGMGEYSGNTEVDMGGKIVLPGFVDAHIHLESSLVSPTEFAKAVLPHGTTTVITDPHEIANVMGTDGIEYMLQATEDLPVDVRFMLPSCVPATPLDESGANLDYRAIDSFYDHPRVQGLAEMMNFVGTINGDPQVVETGYIRLMLIMPSHLFSLCYEVLSGYLRGFEISLPPAVLTMLGVCGVRLSWLRWVFPQYKTFMNIMLVFPISLATTALLMLAAVLYFRPSRRYAHLQKSDGAASAKIEG